MYSSQLANSPSQCAGYVFIIYINIHFYILSIRLKYSNIIKIFKIPDKIKLNIKIINLKCTCWFEHLIILYLFFLHVILINQLYKIFCLYENFY